MIWYTGTNTVEEFYAEDGYSTFLQTLASVSQITWHCTQKTVITMQKGLKYHIGGCISILLDLMLISHEVGETKFTLMYTNTFLKVDLNCFTTKKGDIEY